MASKDLQKQESADGGLCRQTPDKGLLHHLILQRHLHGQVSD